MKVFVRTAALLMVLALAALQSGCVFGPGQPTVAPTWIERGSGAFNDGGVEVFYGVGSASGGESRSQTEQIANLRARADIAAQLDPYVLKLYHAYQAAILARTGKPAPPEQYPELTLGTISEVAVHGVRIVGTWRDPKTGTVYSLAKLEVAEIKASLPQMSGVDPALLQYIRGNAGEVFKTMQKAPMEPEKSKEPELKGK